MNSKSVVFSHQRETVLALSGFFDSIDVFTAEPSLDPLPKNVRVFDLSLDTNSGFKNIFTLLKTLYPYLIKNRKSVIFTHMTDSYAALISPLTSIMRMRHILWYAHAHNSYYLILSSYFVSGIVSSTEGSCNLKVNRKKVKFINQGIKQNDFFFSPRTLIERSKIIYYGRLDPSKNIHLLVDLVEKLNGSNGTFTLDIFGSTYNINSNAYLKNIKSSLLLKNSKVSVTFNDPIERIQLPYISKKYDVFINLFSGSLDKTLVEATFMGLPVITWNQEYCKEFGTWSKVSNFENLDFVLAEFYAFRSMKGVELSRELERRRLIALAKHSFEGWIDRLVYELKGENFK
jgi:glycosyltransferase involved in cell wall biosynthesis